MDVFIAIISLLLATYLVVKVYYVRQIKKNVFLYVECFIRHMHNEAFYQDKTGMGINTYQLRWHQFHEKKDKWYLSGKSRKFIEANEKMMFMIVSFYKWMVEKMNSDHYFTFTELQQCPQFLQVHLLREIINEEFLFIVNKYEPKSFHTLDEYHIHLDWDIKETVKEHNNLFVQKELEENRTFFDTVMKYPLDTQQRESIVKLEHNTLVVSSAGSGKTSTTVGKIKYLVEKKELQPSKILPLTYTRKAAEELSSRLGYQDKGMICHTFHSLAFLIIKTAGEQKPDMCQESAFLQAFYHQAAINPAFKKGVNTYLTRWASLTKNSHDYTSAKQYYADRALYGIQAPFLDIDKRIIFTRSEEEKKICNFLTLNGVLFRYECPFPYETADKNHRQYIPDFTIYVKREGKWHFFILEHFGIDRNGNVPQWFGTHKQGGWLSANNKYREGIKWKREIATRYNIPLIETTSAMFHDGNIFTRLAQMLQEHGVTLKPLSEEETFDRLVVRNKRMEDSLVQLIGTFITLMKAGEKTFEDILKTLREQKDIPSIFIKRSEFMIEQIFKPVYNDYCQYLNRNKKLDYTDLIIKATQLCQSGKYKSDYDYILVDEFQDISVDRFRLLQALRRADNTTKLYCVGDDWQSIFRFSGSDLSLFSDFDKFFGFTEKCRIETTYRFGNPLIKTSSDFILANPSQIKKNVRPIDNNKATDLTFHPFNGETGGSWSILISILKQIPDNESVMLVGRYHSDADIIPNGFVGNRDSNGRPIALKWQEKIIPFNTVHSAKGLEADHVIITNCSQDGNGFPSKVCDDPILGYVLSKAESYAFAEERRLFYVAITRARKHTYILYKDTCPSPFITETNKMSINKSGFMCPLCEAGQLRIVKEGTSSFSQWRLYRCSNNTAGCDYSWFVNFHNEEDIDKYFKLETKQ